jgi:putative membrane protein
MMSIAFALRGVPPYDWGGPGGWWVIFPILWVLLIATLVTVAVVVAVRRNRLSGQRAGERRLAELYASGEIDEQEYRTRLSTLKGLNVKGQ